MSGRYVPEELLTKIFCDLPAKSLGRCKCVNNQWDSLISSSEFVELHHSRLGVDKLLVATNTSPSILYSIKFEITNGMVTSGHASRMSFDCLKIWGSYHGIILVENRFNLMLMNPNSSTSNQVTKLPILFPVNRPYRRFNVFGFGYDSSCNDYCVVAISWFRFTAEPVNEFLVSVYWVREGIWSEIGNSPYNHDLDENARGILVNNKMHWFAQDDEGFLTIVAYGLSDKRFEQVMSPPNDLLQEFYSKFPVLEVVHDCLSLIFSKVDENTHIWIMRNYGVGESWTKLAFVLTNISHIVPLSLADNCLVVEEGGKFILLVSNSEGVVRKDLEVFGLPDDDFTTEVTVVDSLFSLVSRDGKVSLGLEAVVRGHKSELLSAADYNSLCQCETVEDIKIYLSATWYCPYFQNELDPLHATTIVEKCTLRLYDEFKAMLCQATEPLSTFLEYIRYGHMIDNVVLIVSGTLHERDVQELLEKCHPLGMFDSIANLAVAQNMQELYRLVLVNTPLGPYFSECITSEDFTDMNIEIMRNTLYKAYLEDFYRLSQKLGGATAEIMSDLLAFESDRRAVNITINSIGTKLTQDDRRKLYSSFGLLYPNGHVELALCEDFDQVHCVMEKYPPYQSIFSKLSSAEIQMLDKTFFDEEVKRLCLSFEQQFHYAVFFAYVRLREQEIRNLMWICECVAQDQKSRVQDNIVFIS